MKDTGEVKPIKRKLTKFGNSWAIIVPKNVREMFGWKEGQVLEVPFHLFKKKNSSKKDKASRESKSEGTE